MAHVPSHDEFRSAVIQLILDPKPSNDGPMSIDHINTNLAYIAKDREWQQETHNGIVPAVIQSRTDYPILSGPTTARIWNVVWDMLVEGLVRPGMPGHGDGKLGAFHLTEFGLQVLAVPASPYDPDGYMKRLRERVPNADPIILTYIAESMETLRRHCLLSSTITLGCASEKAIILLIEAFEDSLNPSDQAKFHTAIERARTIKSQHDEFMKWYESKVKSRLKSDKGSDWISQMDNALMLLFSHFRLSRNDAGHPTGTVISREEAHEHLIVFPRYLQRIYELMDWLSASKPI